MLLLFLSNKNLTRTCSLSVNAKRYDGVLRERRCYIVKLEKVVEEQHHHSALIVIVNFRHVEISVDTQTLINKFMFEIGFDFSKATSSVVLNQDGKFGYFACCIFI